MPGMHELRGDSSSAQAKALGRHLATCVIRHHSGPLGPCYTSTAVRARDTLSIALETAKQAGHPWLTSEQVRGHVHFVHMQSFMLQCLHVRLCACAHWMTHTGIEAALLVRKPYVHVRARACVFLWVSECVCVCMYTGSSYTHRGE